MLKVTMCLSYTTFAAADMALQRKSLILRRDEVADTALSHIRMRDQDTSGVLASRGLPPPY